MSNHPISGEPGRSQAKTSAAASPGAQAPGQQTALLGFEHGLHHTAAAGPPASSAPAALPRQAANDNGEHATRGFAIGWDFARLGLVPPAQELHADSAVDQGWRAGRAVHGRSLARALHSCSIAHTSVVPRLTREWLALRLLAWQQGQVFQDGLVTPEAMAQWQQTHCPATRQPLGGAAGTPTAASWMCLDSSRGYQAGEVVQMSQAAAQQLQAAMAHARQSGQAVPLALAARARMAEQGQTPDDEEPALLWRLAALVAMASPAADLPYHQALTLPLACQPAAGSALRNPAQRLQVALTRIFLLPNWSRAIGRVAQALPSQGSLRTELHLFMGALAPRVVQAQAAMQAGVERQARGDDGHAGTQAQVPCLEHVLEDAWLLPRVQLRWQQLALALGPEGARDLVRALKPMMRPLRPVWPPAPSAIPKQPSKPLAPMKPALPRVPAHAAPAAMPLAATADWLH